MATPRRPLYYTGDANCPTSTFGANDCIFGENLPAGLPRPWSNIAQYNIGDEVFYNEKIWVTRAAINSATTASPNTAPSLSRDSVWEPVAASLTRLTGSDSSTALTAANSGFHELRFAINEGQESASVRVSSDSSVSGNNDGLITINLPAGGGGDGDITSVVAGEGLNGGATSGAATLNLDRSIAKVSLFLGARLDNLDVEVTLAGAARTASAYVTSNINDGNAMYFIPGVQLSGSDFITGSGVWTSVLDPSIDTLDSTNTFNLIG